MVKVITGSVLSILMPVWVSSAVLPALSVQVPVADWSCPSAVIFLLIEASKTSEVSSSHVQVTVTSVLFQPFELGSVLSL